MRKLMMTTKKTTQPKAPRKAAAPKTETAKAKNSILSEKATLEKTLSRSAVEKQLIQKAPEQNSVAAPTAKKPSLTLKQDSPSVAKLQARLAELGDYKGPWDGHYGQATAAALAVFQTRTGLVADGRATDETLLALGF
jgi:peptidoglycan hydrolase-like protein with peptidoglycan-binding domain